MKKPFKGDYWNYSLKGHTAIKPEFDSASYAHDLEKAYDELAAENKQLKLMVKKACAALQILIISDSNGDKQYTANEWFKILKKDKLTLKQWKDLFEV